MRYIEDLGQRSLDVGAVYAKFADGDGLGHELVRKKE